MFVKRRFPLMLAGVDVKADDVGLGGQEKAVAINDTGIVAPSAIPEFGARFRVVGGAGALSGDKHARVIRDHGALKRVLLDRLAGCGVQRHERTAVPEICEQPIAGSDQWTATIPVDRSATAALPQKQTIEGIASGDGEARRLSKSLLVVRNEIEVTSVGGHSLS